MCMGCYSQENLIWLRIPKFYVDNYVVNFLNNHQINDCFSKFENENTLLLKCWRNNNLVDIQIKIDEKRRKRFIPKILSI